MNDYATSQHCAYFSHVCKQSDCYHRDSISSTYPLAQQLFWFARFKTVTCFRSTALNTGHVFSFFYPSNKSSFVALQMRCIQLKHTQPFHFIVCVSVL